jgi:hypothetical protein
MDLLVLILILLSGYIIKYLIDTINTLNNEIREIKMKCISAKSDVQFDTPPTATTAKTATASAASAASPVANAANDVLIKNITYFKDYFDKQ